MGRLFARWVSYSGLVLFTANLFTTEARAALIINVNEVRSNVVITASGALNLAALSSSTGDANGGLIWGDSPLGSVLSVGPQEMVPAMFMKA